MPCMPCRAGGTGICTRLNTPASWLVLGEQNAHEASTVQSASVSQVAPPSTVTRTVLLSEPIAPPSSTFHDRKMISGGSGNGRVRA